MGMVGAGGWWVLVDGGWWCRGRPLPVHCDIQPPERVLLHRRVCWPPSYTQHAVHSSRTPTAQQGMSAGSYSSVVMRALQHSYCRTIRSVYSRFVAHSQTPQYALQPAVGMLRVVAHPGGFCCSNSHGINRLCPCVFALCRQPREP